MEMTLKNRFRVLLSFIALFFILYGVWRDETPVVLNKAVNICLECIGLG